MWAAIQDQILQWIGDVRFGDLDFFQSVLFLIAHYLPSYINGAGNTLLLALVGTAAGCVIGLAVGVVQTIPLAPKDSIFKKIVVKFFRALLTIYVEVFRGTPMMVQGMLFYYGLAYAGIFLPLWPTAILVVSINTGAYMAETVRGGILSIDPGQTEGAKAIGMSHVQTMLHVIMPQTLRNIMPQIGNNLIINIKDTCVLMVIGFMELYSRHAAVSGARYAFFESSVITMIIYLTMTWTLSRILRLVEKKMDGSDSYDLATTDSLAHTTGLYSYPERGSNFDERHPEQPLERNPVDLEKENKKHNKKGRER